MSERLIKRVDTYFRREDTLLARGLHAVSPQTGLEYRTSRRKEIMERALAFPIAVAATPVMGALAAVIKLEDGGPVLYRQFRVGKNGAPVEIIKLRSLHLKADTDSDANIANTHAIGNGDDPRSTRIGAVMRRTKLDELPQLWQVVAGTLALFGSRPAAPLTYAVMKEDRPDVAEEHFTDVTKSKPGVINPATGFSNKGGSNERYHTNALYNKKASLGTDLYLGFRIFANHFLRRPH